MRTLLAIVAALAVLYPAASQAQQDLLASVRERDSITVGVKADYPPFGMRDAEGALVGVEPDLAADLARRLGVNFRLVPVTSANRLTKLQDGEVDILIATLGDTDTRRELVTMVEPNYYAAGVNVLARKRDRLSDWSQLRGQSVCATQGALFNRTMAERHLLRLQVFNDNRDAKLGLQGGRCIGWLYDDVALLATLHEPGWEEYEMPLASTLVGPWAIAVAKGEHTAALARFVGDTIGEWHREGFLVRVAESWGVGTAFLRDQHDLWNRRTEDGGFLCTRGADGRWPAACRNPALLTAADVSGSHWLALRIREITGTDISLLYDRFDRTMLLSGLGTTLLLVVACVAGSLLIGLVLAVAMAARIPLLSPLVTAVTSFVRTTPPLLQLYLVYFGIGGMIAASLGFTVNAFLVASIVLAAYAGAANAYAIYDAVTELRRRSPDRVLDRTTLAHASRLAYGPVMASCVNIAKATGLASTIAVPELINATTGIVAEKGNTDFMVNLLMVLYFLIVLGVVWAFERFDRWLARHVAG